MLKWICAVAFASAFAAPAFAQKTDLPDRPLKQTKPFDQAPLKEGVAAVRQSGECTVTYIVDAKGIPADLKAECTPAEMAPYAVRMVQTGEWQSEITGGEFFDSYPQKQVFKFGAVTAAAAADPRGDKAPVVTTELSPRDVNSAISMVGRGGKCNVTFTVGTDGVPKDIKPNCEPRELNPRITDAVKKMRYTPGQKGGAPVEWPNMALPLSLANNE